MKEQGGREKEEQAEGGNEGTGGRGLGCGKDEGTERRNRPGLEGEGTGERETEDRLGGTEKQAEGGNEGTGERETEKQTGTEDEGTRERETRNRLGLKIIKQGNRGTENRGRRNRMKVRMKEHEEREPYRT
ncbi:hypothetical protein Pcinc_035040 [Petrolisthes cinctipes]|uniref:Uncharacterized protein n=1 Tax=Petrolisthes cinctipes TaxID=88211 RepID=A0AAE1BXK0_PETCI|nr:hypothetical protein Pcinc_035040 [Petrolisthes cinctipes]